MPLLHLWTFMVFLRVNFTFYLCVLCVGGGGEESNVKEIAKCWPPHVFLSVVEENAFLSF
jgi:hypothetical protein